MSTTTTETKCRVEFEDGFATVSDSEGNGLDCFDVNSEGQPAPIETLDRRLEAWAVAHRFNLKKAKRNLRAYLKSCE